MKKLHKIAIAVIVACLFAGAVLSLSACKDEEVERYCELAMVKVNRCAVEWESNTTNFTGYQNTNMSVTVPYTDYIAFTTLIASKGAEAKVYSDEACAQALDADKIRQQTEKAKYYIRVTLENESRVYTVEVTIRQENLPEGIDLSARTYDNREGHIYIPEDAKSVVIDGETYRVMRTRSDVILTTQQKEFQRNILANDITDGFYSPYGVLNGLFDGNNYVITLLCGDQDVDPLFANISESGIAKNFTIRYWAPRDTFVEADGNRTIGSSYALCNTNKGIINNVVNTGSTYILQEDDHKDSRYYASLFVITNSGEISDCLNYGKISTMDKLYPSRVIGIFACKNAEGSSYRNCVNMGKIEVDDQGEASVGIFGNYNGEPIKTEALYDYGKPYQKTEAWDSYFVFGYPQGSKLSFVRKYL